MKVQVRVIGNLPYMVKGLQKQYDDIPLPDGARLADLLRLLDIKRDLFALAEGKRLDAEALLYDGMEITLVSPSAGG
ncbi:MAG: hypothetical protein FWF04_05915 [Clostridiales bacterium]|nr:hypothetical protein [Clostridiales bacterium]